LQNFATNIVLVAELCN